MSVLRRNLITCDAASHRDRTLRRDWSCCATLPPPPPPPPPAPAGLPTRNAPGRYQDERFEPRRPRAHLRVVHFNQRPNDPQGREAEVLVRPALLPRVEERVEEYGDLGLEEQVPRLHVRGHALQERQRVADAVGARVRQHGWRRQFRVHGDDLEQQRRDRPEAVPQVDGQVCGGRGRAKLAPAAWPRTPAPGPDGSSVEERGTRRESPGNCSRFLDSSRSAVSRIAGLFKSTTSCSMFAALAIAPLRMRRRSAR